MEECFWRIARSEAEEPNSDLELPDMESNVMDVYLMVHEAEETGVRRWVGSDASQREGCLCRIPHGLHSGTNLFQHASNSD